MTLSLALPDLASVESFNGLATRRGLSATAPTPPVTAAKGTPIHHSATLSSVLHPDETTKTTTCLSGDFQYESLLTVRLTCDSFDLATHLQAQAQSVSSFASGLRKAPHPIAAIAPCNETQGGGGTQTPQTPTAFADAKPQTLP